MNCRTVGNSVRVFNILIVILMVAQGSFLRELKAKKRLWPALIIVIGAILLASDGVIDRTVDKISILLL